MILLSDLVQFLARLETVERELRGSAEFTTLEEQLRLTVTCDHLGYIRVDGYAKDDASFGNRLTFGFELDQTFLRRTISELSRAVLECR